MPASRLRQPPQRRATSARPTGSDAQPSGKSQIPGWFPYAAAALLGVWLLQAVVGPLLPRAAEIPYSEFKVKLAEGQVTDVTLGTPIEGVMKTPEGQTPAQPTTRFATLPPPDGDPDLISIIPRSRGSLGYTMQMPKEGRYLLSIEELNDQIAVMMGGRAAEHVMLGTISTGAVDDIQRATQLARRMVTEFGMSDKLGSVRYAGQRLQYLGTAVAESSDASGATHETIDAEVRRIVGEQFERATTVIAAHRGALERLSTDLLNAESLDGSAVRAALSSAGHAVAS